MEKILNRLNQHINRAESQKRTFMNKQKLTSQEARQTRTRQYIQLGALIETAGLLETFEIPLGVDLQKDPETQRPVAALFKGLLELNSIAQSGDIHMQLYAEQGLAELRKLKEETPPTYSKNT